MQLVGHTRLSLGGAISATVHTAGLEPSLVLAINRVRRRGGSCGLAEAAFDERRPQLIFDVPLCPADRHNAGPARPGRVAAG